MPDQAPKARTFADQLDQDFAPAWRPEPGGSLVGFVSSLSIGQSDYGPYPIIEITTEKGERFALHGFHTVVKSRLIELRPTIGEEIGIKYNGMRLPRGADPKLVGTKNDPSYQDYRILMNRPEQDMWATLADPSGE